MAENNTSIVDNISTVDKDKPVSFKIEIKSHNTDYLWKELPNTFSDDKEDFMFDDSIPRHVSHRIIKTTVEIIKEHNPDKAHYLG